MNRVLFGDCIQELKKLPQESVHCCVTSPPYFHLRSYNVEGQIGLEESPEAYVEKMVQVFREVKRVLRDDGTLWLNIGDSYSSGGRTTRDHDKKLPARHYAPRPPTPQGLKPKDLIGIPWLVAFALRNDGWYLRSDIIWEKKNCMPDSVQDRPTRSHEYVFLLAKSESYFYDIESIKEPCVSDAPSGNTKRKQRPSQETLDIGNLAGSIPWEVSPTKNKRTVWSINTKPFRGAHFAVYPEELVKPCVLAGTSQKGCCPDCGAPWTRVTEALHKKAAPMLQGEWEDEAEEKGLANGDTERGRTRIGLDRKTAEEKQPRYATVGWEPTCKCGKSETVPCTVLDPFFGSGTTGVVAALNGRNYIGVELNPDYIKIAQDRLQDALGMWNDNS